MIRLICFDIDDTLMDFHKGEEIAFMECMKDFNIVCSKEDYLLYQRINLAFWKALERKEVTKDELMVQRFEVYKKERQIDCDAYLMSKSFEKHLGEQCFLFDGANDVVKKCASFCDLAVTTNGIASSQRNRLKKSNLMEYFKYLFISEEIGFPKPQIEYYQEIFKQSGCKPQEILFIGDSLTSDIQGAIDSGCISVWYNPKHLEKPEHMKIEFEIHHLDEIFEILEKQL